MATSIQDLHPDIMTCALRRLDGPSLAAVGCASSHLRSISSDPSIWRDLCLSTWPSLRHPVLHSLLRSCNDYRSLFASAFPFPCQSPVLQTSSTSAKEMSPVLPRKLIGAVDLHHRGELVFSKVVEIDTSSAWFLGAPFRIDVLDEKSSCDRVVPLPGDIGISELKLSWILIDPDSKKAVNVSSRSPVSIDRHWYTGETLVKYGMVINDMLIGIVVTCGEDGGHLREVSMTIEDADGIGVCGRESLATLTEAMMRGTRRWRGDGREETEAKRRHDDFVRRRRSRKESKARKECLFDLCCTGVSAIVFVSLIGLVAFK